MPKYILALLLSTATILLYLFISTPSIAPKELKPHYPPPSLSTEEEPIHYQVLSQEIPMPKEQKVAYQDELKLILPKELNISRDKEVSLELKIQNLLPDEHYTIFWKEQHQLVGMGENLSTTFGLGDHLLKVSIKTDQGRESNTTMLVRAWNYLKVEKHYYHNETEVVDDLKIAFYDHLEHLILERSANDEISYTYNEEGKIIEKSHTYPDLPQKDTIKYLEYDKNKNLRYKQTVDYMGKTIDYESYEYDEENNLISIKTGEDEYHQKEILTHPEEQNSNQEEESENQYDENNNLIHFVINMSFLKVVVDKQYNEQNQTIEIKQTNFYKEEKSSNFITHYEYDSEGNIIGKSFLSKDGDETQCQYTQSKTYNPKGQLTSREHQILSGDCYDYIDYLSESYRYDKEGNIIEEKKLILDQNSSKKNPHPNYEIIKIKRHYTNELQ